MLKSPDARARAAAVRVLCYQRDRVPEALELLKTAAADESPRVRLMAIWAASFFTVPEAVEIVFIAQDKPVDLYIDHEIKETLRALNPVFQKAIADKRPIKFTTPAGTRYFLKNVSTDELIKMERSPGVFLELLFRPGIRDEFRREAMTGLAKSENKAELAVLVDAIKKHDDSGVTEESVAYDLIRILTSRPQTELAGIRADLETLAKKGRTTTTRQLGFVAVIAADGDVEGAWKIGTASVPALQDLVAAMPMIRDPGQRAALYPKVEGLLKGLPPDLAKTVAGGKTTMGRYVRIELPGKQRTLTLAEVEVYSDGKNVARGGKAKQASTAHGGTADKAIDGNKSGTYADGGQTHSAESTDEPWWELDLGREMPLEKIVIFNRTDGALGTRLSNYSIKILDTNRRVAFESLKNPTPAKGVAEFAVGSASPERIVRRSSMVALASVRGKEADAFKAIAPFLKDDFDRHPALQALLRIPQKEWPKEQAEPLLGEVMAFIRSLPVAERTTPVALDAMQLGDGLTNLLPPDRAKAARKELGEIGVRVIRVGTLTDQMLFDKDRIVVQAGKPVEFMFENTDIMPHNFVIIRPGSLVLVGDTAEVQGAQPGAAERGYVPSLEEPGTILLFSKLLQPQQSQQLRFNVPNVPGIYPYVCTYPGHWRRMHGALYVVADLDAYLENPEAYLAKNPLPIKDELLKFNRPRTEWKLEELADAVKEMDAHGGRNYANGKQMFTVSTCIACHKFNGQGNEFGPDLAKLDPKVYPNSTELLKHIIDPSLKIDDRYATYRIVLNDDSVVNGVIVEEKDGIVKVIENPLANAKPKEIKAAAIVEKKKALTSMMPKNLMDKLTKDEILDLAAYVWSKGDPKHKVFEGHHQH
jgi:putative heme-binding domain-containing protein